MLAALPPSPTGRGHGPRKRGRTTANRRPAVLSASRPSHRRSCHFAQPEAAAIAAQDSSDPTAAAATTAAPPVEKVGAHSTDVQPNRKKIRFIKHLEGRYMTKANAAAFEQMGEFFAALRKHPKLIPKIIIELRRLKCRGASRAQFDRVREYVEPRLYGGLNDGFQQIKDEVAKHAAMQDTEQEAMCARPCAAKPTPPAPHALIVPRIACAQVGYALAPARTSLARTGAPSLSPPSSRVGPVRRACSRRARASTARAALA